MRSEAWKAHYLFHLIPIHLEHGQGAKGTNGIWQTSNLVVGKLKLLLTIEHKDPQWTRRVRACQDTVTKQCAQGSGPRAQTQHNQPQGGHKHSNSGTPDQTLRQGIRTSESGISVI
mgnify:CR=1 FL=1